MGDTSIEWTSKTWNPIRGCSVVSDGCRNCYAMNFATRFAAKGEAYEGLAYRNTSGAHWTGQVKFIEEHLADPLKVRKPTKWFVNSMSDLFHEGVSDQQITDIFGIMALAHWHTFQVLTKRPQRMLDYLRAGDHGIINQFEQIQRGGGIGPPLMFKALDMKRRDNVGWEWPLPNVHLGVSVEDQKTADERIPLLLETPAAVRWISAEPLLGSVDLTHIDYSDRLREVMRQAHGDEGAASINASAYLQTLTGQWFDGWDRGNDGKRLDWVVVGGESGTGAREMHLEWARGIVNQCQSAGVPVFVKQLGAHPVLWRDDDPEVPPYEYHFENHKGGDINEWPEDLRIREFPKAV